MRTNNSPSTRETRAPPLVLPFDFPLSPSRFGSDGASLMALVRTRCDGRQRDPRNSGAHDACHCILRNRPSRGLYAWRLKRVKCTYGICALGLYNHTKLKRSHIKNTARYVQPTHFNARALIRCEGDVLGKSPGKTPLSSALTIFSPTRFTYMSESHFIDATFSLSYCCVTLVFHRQLFSSNR